jgi:arsenate reductase-like glutaredoxin family protein
LIAEADLDELNTNKIVPVEKLKNTQTEVETPAVIEIGQISTGESEENVPVSHETNETAQEIAETKPIATTVNNMEDATPNEEELLNVLVQASRDALVKAQQQWVMLPKYLNSATTAKVASILLDGYPVAACDNVIILGYNNDVYLNRVNAEGNYEEMNNFLKALYNNDMKCYCLTIQTFTNLKEKYMTLRQLGKLPKPVPIVIQRRNIEVKDDPSTPVDEGIEYAKKLFGDNLIIKGE